MTWCITTCNFDVDVDLLFQENSTIGQKMCVLQQAKNFFLQIGSKWVTLELKITVSNPQHWQAPRWRNARRQFGLFAEALTFDTFCRALTEKIVAVLPKMKCPHRIEPHQIQGLDFIHIYPVVQVCWMSWQDKHVCLCRNRIFICCCSIAVVSEESYRDSWRNGRLHQTVLNITVRQIS